MNDIKDLKVIDENGTVIGTLDEILNMYNQVVQSEMIKVADRYNKEKYLVSKNQECPIGFVRTSKTCSKCYHNKYCKSFEKEL